MNLFYRYVVSNYLKEIEDIDSKMEYMGFVDFCLDFK